MSIQGLQAYTNQQTLPNAYSLIGETRDNNFGDLSFKKIVSSLKDVFGELKDAEKLGEQGILEKADPFEVIKKFNEAHASLQIADPPCA